LKDLRLLADLPFLSSVWLQSNPVSYEAVYRISVFSYFNRNRHTIILDGDKPSMTEQLLIESITDQLLPIRVQTLLFFFFFLGGHQPNSSPGGTFSFARGPRAGDAHLDPETEKEHTQGGRDRRSQREPCQ